MLSRFSFSLKFNRSETGAVFYMLHGGWFVWPGDVFVKQFCTSKRLVDGLLITAEAQFVISCQTKELTPGLAARSSHFSEELPSWYFCNDSTFFSPFAIAVNMFLCPRNTNMAEIGCDM